MTTANEVRAELLSLGRAVGRIPDTNSLWMVLGRIVWLLPEQGSPVKCGEDVAFYKRVSEGQIRFTGDL